MFFSKPKGPKVTDVIFLNENGFKHAIAKWMQQHADGIVGTWFQQDLEHLRQAFPGEAEHRFALSDRLAFMHDSGSKPILFAGHYPLHSSEQSLCDELGLKEMEVYSHLDMGLFHFFGGEKLKELMTTMVVQEDEPLTHAMITKAISNAQDKIAKQCPADLHALSEAEWMRVNVQPK